MARIELENVSKVFGGHTALEDLDLDISDGEFFVLLGPTGAGKTTTLRLIAGLETPTVGHIRINGVEVNDWSPSQRDVALVLQQYSLYPRLTVRDNLSFPLRSKVRNASPAEIDERVAYAARTLRIEHLLDRKTDRLSGGEMQRVSIGRAIVREPHVFLMDEPLSNLDAKLREAMRSELKDLQMRLGTTFLFVTHDQVKAMTMGDRIAVLNAGRLEQIGTPHDIYRNPRNTFVAGFVGSPAINLMAGHIEQGRAIITPGSFELPLDAGPAGDIGKNVTFGIRPEDLQITSGGPVEATVHDVENYGTEQIVTLRAGTTLLRASVPAHVGIRVEEPVRFGWTPAKVMFFDKQNGTNIGRAT
ncbi:MAG: ABC transporter ATP-binding protein [Candidatus Saccharibacteria bacterium]|nr:ABC transporter ATP-binding protein [Pseudorhodobacter sp.]